MDESEVLRDILERLDKVTQHIIEIKSEMYLKSEHREDIARVYARIAEVHKELVDVVKEAVKALNDSITAVDKAASIKYNEHESKFTSVNGLISNLQTTVNRPRVPSWVVSLISGAVALAGQQGLAFLEKAYGLKH